MVAVVESWRLLSCMRKWINERESQQFSSPPSLHKVSCCQICLWPRVVRIEGSLLFLSWNVSVNQTTQQLTAHRRDWMSSWKDWKTRSNCFKRKMVGYWHQKLLQVTVTRSSDRNDRTIMSRSISDKTFAPTLWYHQRTFRKYVHASSDHNK